MKYLTIICMFLSYSLYSQAVVPLYKNAQQLPVLSTTSLSDINSKFDHFKNGNYAKDTGNQRDQYVGTWEYNQGGIIFQIKIEKQDMVLDKREFNGMVDYYSYCDKVAIRYKIVKNGNIIFDNLISVNTSNENSYGIKRANYNYLDGRILDYTRNVIGSYTIMKPFSTSTKIKFNLGLGNYHILNDRSFYNDGQPLFSIPIGEIEMTKVN